MNNISDDLLLMCMHAWSFLLSIAHASEVGAWLWLQ